MEEESVFPRVVVALVVSESDGAGFDAVALSSFVAVVDDDEVVGGPGAAQGPLLSGEVEELLEFLVSVDSYDVSVVREDDGFAWVSVCSVPGDGYSSFDSLEDNAVEVARELTEVVFSDADGEDLACFGGGDVGF